MIAEKHEAIVSLGMTNTRLKDYFDLWFLATYAKTDEAVLRQAIQATFARRRIEVRTALPLGLSDAFAASLIKQQQRSVFLSKKQTHCAKFGGCVSCSAVHVGVARQWSDRLGVAVSTLVRVDYTV